MNFDINIWGALLMIVMFFVGRASGIASETYAWLDTIAEGKPIIRKGEIFIAKHLGGDE